MKSGYDQFFKNAKRAADGKPAEPMITRTETRKSSNEMADALRKKMKPTPHSARPNSKRKAQATPWKFISLSVMGLMITGLGLWQIDTIVYIVKNIEISMLGAAYAEEAAPAKAQAPAKADAAAVAAAPAKTEYSNEEINHFSKLNERKRELDAREEELARAEGELAAQRTELEKKLTELESTRRNISSVLEEKVKIDEGKVETLVQMYSNMKAQQAAKVFETMDEDLAIEILGRMKKKNAAEIMGFVKSEKVQKLTEKFAGYKN